MLKFLYYYQLGFVIIVWFNFFVILTPNELILEKMYFLSMSLETSLVWHADMSLDRNT